MKYRGGPTSEAATSEAGTASSSVVEGGDDGSVSLASVSRAVLPLVILSADINTTSLPLLGVIST